MSDVGRGGGSRRRGEPSFAELFEASTSGRQLVSVGDRVEGTVVSVGKEYVFLDLGTRTDGLLPLAEVERDGAVTVEVGDRIEVLATSVRDGAVMCARRVGAATREDRGADREAALATLAEAFETGMPVEGLVKESNKGGYSVSLLGLRAFCPISQIQRGFCEDPSEHVGRTYSFAIVELDGSGRNVVVSRRRLLEAEAEVVEAERWKTLEVGQVLTGTVSSMKSYGAFVDIGGVEGLLHVSEISFDRIGDPSDVLAPGQQVEVAIKELDREKKRISLSLKALAEDPWLAAAERLGEGVVLTGRVSRLARFGAFVEVDKGVEGLLHISELGGERHIATPREVVKPGDEVRVRVLSVDAERRRIALALAGDEDEAEAAEALETMRKKGRSGGGGGLGTFGDLFKDALKK